MNTPQRLRAISFWKIYGIVMAVDLLLYILIFYVGRAIPAAAGDSSPGNYGLVLYWLFAHFPAFLIFRTWVLPDSLMWLLILQDAWVPGLIYWWSWTVRRSKLVHASKSIASTGQK